MAPKPATPNLIPCRQIPHDRSSLIVNHLIGGLMPLQLQNLVTQSDNQVGASIDGEMVLMSVDQGRYFNLNPVGTAIWALLQQPIKVTDLCASLQQDHTVDPTICERDVLAFLGKLQTHGLISVQ
jgi:Coenzyme PQQ synthesis protein D (PqqD)